MLDDTLDVGHFAEPDDRNPIRVLGVGGCGTNMVNYIFREGKTEGVDFWVCNTDKVHLDNSSIPAENKLVLGLGLLKGLGTGDNPDLGAEAAGQTRKEIESMLSGTEILFLAAGMGKGTGTGASPVIAEIAEEMGILTVAVVTMPFKHEGVNEIAERGLNQLKKKVNGHIVVNNQKMFESDENLNSTRADTENKVNKALADSMLTISNIVTENYNINVDLNDLKRILKHGGYFIGYAEASGENAVEKAVDEVLAPDTFTDTSIKGATIGIIKIVSKEPIYNRDENHIYKTVTEATERKLQPRWISGGGVNPDLKVDVTLTVIATGFEEEDVKKSKEKPSSAKKSQKSLHQPPLDFTLD